MSVADGVELPVADEFQGVVELQHQVPAGRHLGGPVPQRAVEVVVVDQAVHIHHQIGAARVERPQSQIFQSRRPGTPMGAMDFPERGPFRQLEEVREPGGAVDSVLLGGGRFHR